MNEALEKFNPGALAGIIGADNIAAINDDFSGGISSSDFLPTISIKGREFRLKINGEETRLPNKTLNVFLISSRPSVSKIFYREQWSGGDNASAPDCSSADGIQPDDNAKEPQHSNCGNCEHNAWGSKITQAGKKGKACADYKMIVVSLQAAPDAPFVLRIPAASLKIFSAYIAKLKMAGVPANAAVTQISFTDSEFPQLEFDFVDTVKSKEDYAVLTELAQSAEVLTTVQIKPRAQITASPIAEVHEAVQPVVAEVTEVVAPVVEEEPEVDLATLLKQNKAAAKPKAEKKPKPAPVVEEAPAPEPVASAEPEGEIKGLDDLLMKMKKR